MGRVLQVGRFEIHVDERQLLAEGDTVPLGARAFDLLLVLARSSDQVLSKEHLLSTVWPGVVVEENNLTVQISAVRKALGSEAIATVPHRGYKLTLPVTVIPASARPDHPLPLPAKPSIAVLPFANLSGNPDDECFCDGIAEDVITELSRFHALFVISRNSTFTYKGRPVDVRRVAAELGVQYVLEGSARSAGERVRVAAQLINAATGQQLWAEKYDRRLQDIFAVQEELTRAIVGAIAPQIELSESRRTAGRPADFGAYGIALRAWAMVRASQTQALSAQRDKGVALAYEALAIDPHSGLAIKTVAAARYFDIYYGLDIATPQMQEETLRLADRAVEADNSSHEARLWKGLLLLMCHRDEEAMLDLQAARGLNPNDAITAACLGFFEAICGNRRQACKW